MQPVLDRDVAWIRHGLPEHRLPAFERIDPDTDIGSTGREVS